MVAQQEAHPSGPVRARCRPHSGTKCLLIHTPYTEIHYEPCVVEPNMQYVNMYYNDDVVISQATLYVILQHNQYTRNIEIDDRFIIGFNQVFKVKADKVLMSVGRTPNTAGIGLETLNIEMDRRAIKTDEKCRTNIPNCFAIGDTNAKIMLAHTAYLGPDSTVQL